MMAIWLEIAPVLLLVLDWAGPELDRIGAGPIFGPAPVRYLHFCIVTMLKRLSHKFAAAARHMTPDCLSLDFAPTATLSY